MTEQITRGGATARHRFFMLFYEKELAEVEPARNGNSEGDARNALRSADSGKQRRARNGAVNKTS